MPKRQIILWVGLVLLLLATMTRLLESGSIPPGLQHDEVIYADDGVRSFRQGDFRLFYPNNYGREGLFIWLQGLAVLAFGLNPLALKVVPLACGLLAVALSYRIFGRMYNWQVGAFSAGLMAVSLWPVLTSRFALRAVMMPVWALLLIMGAYLVHCSPAFPARWRWAGVLLIAFSAGGAFYIYTSGPALLMAYGAFLLYLAVVRLPHIRQDWRLWASALGLAVLVILPMIYVRLSLPQGLERVQTVAVPLEALRAGDVAPIIENTWRVLGMPAFTGDPAWRYNIAQRPLFLLPVGLLVYIGGAVALWFARRQPLNVLILLTVAFGVLPSVLTDSTPAYLRAVVAMPGIMFLAGYGLHHLLRIFPVSVRKAAFPVLAGVLLVSTAFADFTALRHEWMRNDEVQTAYLGDFRLLSGYISTLPDEPFVMASSSDVDNDPNVYRYYHQVGNARVVFFDGFANVALTHTPRYLFVSSRSPIRYENARWLTDEYGATLYDEIRRVNGDLAYTVYRLDDTGDKLRDTVDGLTDEQAYHLPDDTTRRDYPLQFAELVRVLAVDVPFRELAPNAGGVNIDLYIQPMQAGQSLGVQFFAHLLDADGNLVAQRDLLGYPASQWHTDVISVQLNYIPFGANIAPGEYVIALGLYNWQTGERYPVTDTDGQPLADYAVVGRVRIAAPN